jgi:hypothetical protein
MEIPRTLMTGDIGLGMAFEQHMDEVFQEFPLHAFEVFLR